MTIDRLPARAQDLTMNRYRVTVIAHRSPSVGAVPGGAGSGILHSEVVRAESAVFARDLVLVRVVAASAVVADVPVGVDTVTVERLRLGRPAVRVPLGPRTATLTASS